MLMTSAMTGAAYRAESVGLASVSEAGGDFSLTVTDPALPAGASATWYFVSLAGAALSQPAPCLVDDASCQIAALGKTPLRSCQFQVIVAITSGGAVVDVLRGEVCGVMAL